MSGFSGSLTVVDLGSAPSTNWERSVKHWGEHRRVTKKWRARVKTLAEEAEWPRGPDRLDRVIVAARPFYRTPSLYTDTGNAYPAVKAAIDGLVDYGLVVDDNHFHVAEIRLLAPKRELTTGLMLKVWEVPAVEGHRRRCGCRKGGR